jgi:hypothetical protein
MSRFLGILSVLAVVLLAMGLAVANAGHRATLDLGLFTLYRVPVTLIASAGLMVGMVVMFATQISTDLRVRQILRERLADEAEKEQRWIDKNQQDLFAGEKDRREEFGEAVVVVEDEVGLEPEARVEDEVGLGPAVMVEDKVEPYPVVMVEDEAEPSPEVMVEDEVEPSREVMVEDEVEPSRVIGDEEEAGTDPTAPQEEETPKE